MVTLIEDPDGPEASSQADSDQYRNESSPMEYVIHRDHRLYPTALMSMGILGKRQCN